MRVEVVANRGAGSGDDEDADDDRRQILAAFEPLGIKPRVAVVKGSALESSIRAAAERGADVVAVAGGDGTLGTAAAALDGTSADLAVLPMGTFNHFAKDLGIPLDLADAARVAVEGESLAVDVAEINGRMFLNNSSIGLYPVMVDLRDEIRSNRGWGKVRAVPVASVRVLRRFPTRRLRIEVAGQQWIRRTPFVFIGNNRYDVGPRGVGARDSLTDGVLSCYVADAETRFAFVRLALKAALRGATRTDDLDHSEGPDVWIDANGHRLLVAIDGEVATMRAPLKYRVRPGALRVRVPAPSIESDDVGATSSPEADPDPAEVGVDEDSEA